MRHKTSILLFSLSAIVFVVLVRQLAIRYLPLAIVPSHIAIESSNHSVVFTGSVPTRIVLKDIGIDLPVISTEVKNNVWPETISGVSFMSNSVVPGETGNSIFWGHNFPRLLGNLDQAQPGQTISVYFTTGKKDFVIAKKAIISATDTSILDATSGAQLTLYTCTGFLDSQRLALVAYTQN